jgi:hypothetical protein
MNVTEGVVAVLIVGITVGLPMLGLTLRFALKPLLEAWLRLQESRRHSSGEIESLRLRVQALEAVVGPRLEAGAVQDWSRAVQRVD